MVAIVLRHTVQSSPDTISHRRWAVAWRYQSVGVGWDTSKWTRTWAWRNARSAEWDHGQSGEWMRTKWQTTVYTTVDVLDIQLWLSWCCSRDNWMRLRCQLCWKNNVTNSLVKPFSVLVFSACLVQCQIWRFMVLESWNVQFCSPDVCGGVVRGVCSSHKMP